MIDLNFCTDLKNSLKNKLEMIRVLSIWPQIRQQIGLANNLMEMSLMISLFNVQLQKKCLVH